MRRASSTWKSQDLPKIVTTGVSGLQERLHVGVVGSGSTSARQVLPKAASLACSSRRPRASRKNSMSRGLEPGHPPST